jgi:ATP-dependent Clp protease ATP-binding subunit ClpA
MADVTNDRDDLQGFDAEARRALTLAEREARALGHSRVGTEHVLLGLLTDKGAASAAALREAGATLSGARRKVSEAVGPGAPDAGEPTSSPRAARAIGRAARFARDQRSDAVGSAHLLLAVLDVEGTAGQVLRGLGVDIEQLRTALGGREAPRPDADLPTSAPPSAAPTCPGCGNAVDALAATTVPASGQGEVVVLSCPACGTIIGTA